MIIGKIDAEAENSKATAKSQGITGYPTIKFFPRGSTEAEVYQGGRDEGSLVEFVNSKAGTFRLAGGLLNAKAGTIEAIDQIIAKFSTAAGIEDLDRLTEEVKEAAETIKSKTVEYYLRTLDKIKENAGYPTKEHTRLAGLLKKGGLAPEKIDQLQQRSNILAKFLVKPAGDDEESSGRVKDEL